jgi:predicted dehydrogenase
MKLRAGVIGVGKLGQHHARIYSEIPDIDFVGIIDKDKNQAEHIAKKCKTQVFTDIKDLVGKVDMVNIAAPTPLHYEIAKFFIQNHIHCLIEKPITVTLEEANELVNLAKENNVIIQVGHIERFNSAVIEAQKYIHNPRFIEVNRLGPYDPRVAHVSVVLDLMIHDLDILLFLTKSNVVSVDAVGTKVLSDNHDIANARIKFANGCVANVSASRISIEKFRKIRIFQEDSYISLDYEKQSLKLYKKKTEHVTSLKDIDIIHPKIQKNEPLLLEILDFIRCVKEGSKPVVDGLNAKNALELALEINNKI